MWFVILIKRKRFHRKWLFEIVVNQTPNHGQKILENFKILGQENSNSMILLIWGVLGHTKLWS